MNETSLDESDRRRVLCERRETRPPGGEPTDTAALLSPAVVQRQRPAEKFIHPVTVPAEVTRAHLRRRAVLINSRAAAGGVSFIGSPVINLNFRCVRAVRAVSWDWSRRLKLVFVESS